VEQRRMGKPVAYITGKKEFYSMEFEVDPRVLIPRPETEILVDEVIHFVKKSAKPLTLCDVGTGSGAIAIVLKKQLPNCHLFAVDLSHDALEVSKLNAQKHEVEIEWIHSDLLGDFKKNVDVVVANLPYISKQQMDTLPKDVKDFEPMIALESGLEG